MKDIRPKLAALLQQGFCTPQIARLAKKLHEPATTLHYNTKKLEREGAVRAYKAVFDYRKIDKGFCAFVLITLSPDEYADPEKIAAALAVHAEVESVDICTGDWELVLKIHAKDQDDYFRFIKNVLSKKGITKIKTLASLKQLKTEFVML